MFKKIIILFSVVFICLPFNLKAVGFSVNSAPVNCDNFSASLNYIGQREANSVGDFNLNKSKTVSVGNEFLAQLEVVADEIVEEEEPIHVVLTIDVSGSMSGEKLSTAKETLISVVDKFIEKGNPKNKLGLVVFDSSVGIYEGLTSDYSSFKSKINSLTAGSGTNLGGAMRTSYTLFGSESNVKKFIVVASDGYDNIGHGVSYNVWFAPEDVTSFAIGIGQSVSDDEMKLIASSGSGDGKYYPVTVDNMKKVFEQLIGGLVSGVPEDVEISFFRDSYPEFGIDLTEPTASINGKKISWDGIDKIEHLEKKKFNIIYSQDSGLENDMPINENKLLIKYKFFGKNCSENVDLNVVKINTSCNPLCLAGGCDSTKICDGECSPSGNEYLYFDCLRDSICDVDENSCSYPITEFACGSQKSTPCSALNCDDTTECETCMGNDIVTKTIGTKGECTNDEEGCVEVEHVCSTETEECPFGYVCREVNTCEAQCIPKVSDWIEF